jgi:[acyl-carrier-protein] S-malonyltransferase
MNTVENNTIQSVEHAHSAAPHVVALFPGQGSQRVGMGKDLAEQSPRARELFDRADEALGFSLSQLCFEGPAEELTKTEIAQPAILTVSTICYQLLQENAPFQLACAAGHSLGEYSALVATNALSFEDAVRLVHHRGQYMQSAVPAGVGKMAAVMGKDLATLEVARAQVTSGVVDIANNNSLGQIVISGDAAGVDELLKILAPVKSIELPVSAPFHCSLMKPAAERLRAEISAVSLRDPIAPIVANVTAAPTQSAVEIKELLYQQVCGTVRWVESMQYVATLAPSARWIEFGFGTTLAGLMKRIDSTIKIAGAQTLEDIGALASMLQGELVACG